MLETQRKIFKTKNLKGLGIENYVQIRRIVFGMRIAKVLIECSMSVCVQLCYCSVMYVLCMNILWSMSWCRPWEFMIKNIFKIKKFLSISELFSHYIITTFYSITWAFSFQFSNTKSTSKHLFPLPIFIRFINLGSFYFPLNSIYVSRKRVTVWVGYDVWIWIP